MNYFFKKTTAIFITIVVLILILSTCFVFMNYKHKQSIESDHKKIKAMMDDALLSADPIKRFDELFPKIISHPRVDSVWISGTTLYLKYKKGGLVSWSVTPESY
jgi:hypothetical protein